MTLATQPQLEAEPGDLYGLLGVAIDATSDEIRRAYKKAASKYHPDRGGDAEKFKAIKQAYEILIDPEKRQGYDATGIFEGEDAAKVEAARGLIGSRIGILLDDETYELEYIDIVATVKHDLRDNLKMCRKGIKHIKKALKRLNKNRKRAKVGLIRSIFDTKIAALEKARETVEQDVEVFELALKLIDTCGYEYDDKPAPEYSYTTFHTGGSGLHIPKA